MSPLAIAYTPHHRSRGMRRAIGRTPHKGAQSPSYSVSGTAGPGWSETSYWGFLVLGSPSKAEQ